jgi:hypothetical protein
MGGVVTAVSLSTMRGLASLVLLAPLVAGSTRPYVSAAWYAGWHATDFPLSQVSWDKYERRAVDMTRH